MLSFCIVGGQKCASSYLQFMISEHPNIILERGENTYFEDHNVDQIESINQKINKKYPNADGKVVGIKRPTYLTNINAAKLLYIHNPKIKIFIIVRDPIERFISAYYHLSKSSYIKPVGLNQTIEKLRNQNFNINDKYNSRLYSLLSYGKFQKYSLFYKKMFKENVKIIHISELKDTSKISSKLFKFLGLNNCDVNISSKSRPMQTVKNSSRLKIWYFLNKHLCTFNKYKNRGYGPSNLFYKYILFIYSIFDKLLKLILKDDNIEISDENYKYLLQYYYEDIKFVKSLLK